MLSTNEIKYLFREYLDSGDIDKATAYEVLDKVLGIIYERGW